MPQGSLKERDDHVSLTQQWSTLGAEELTSLIEGCVSNNRVSQKRIYYSFYSYAMAICQRYANTYDDSVEIVNDGFLKIFKEIHHYKPSYSDVVASFMGWLRKIMIYTAIDHFRKNSKYRFTGELDEGVYQASADGEDAVDKISHEEILRSMQELTPSYRTVINLFIIEGFSHEEIAGQLGISVGTSKSNLARARKQLQKKLSEQNRILLSKDSNKMDGSDTGFQDENHQEKCGGLECSAN